MKQTGSPPASFISLCVVLHSDMHIVVNFITILDYLSLNATEMENSMNNEDLEAFLVEAELVRQKVRDLADNRMSPEEFDRLEALREQDRKRREDYQLRNEREAEELKRRGTSGKGIGKDFKSFCKACHL